MKRIKNTIIALLAIGTMTTLASCDFLNNKTYEEADIIGSWNIDDASATMKVLGVDLVEFITTTTSLLEDEAQAKFDSLASGFLNTMDGSINFSSDYSYNLYLTGLDTEIGTWTLDPDNSDILLTKEGGEEKTYEIQSLVDNDLILDMPADFIAVDLNNDSIAETNVKLVVVLELSKMVKE